MIIFQWVLINKVPGIKILKPSYFWGRLLSIKLTLRQWSLCKAAGHWICMLLALTGEEKTSCLRAKENWWGFKLNRMCSFTCLFVSDLCVFFIDYLYTMSCLILGRGCNLIALHSKVNKGQCWNIRRSFWEEMSTWRLFSFTLCIVLVTNTLSAVCVLMCFQSRLWDDEYSNCGSVLRQIKLVHYSWKNTMITDYSQKHWMCCCCCSILALYRWMNRSEWTMKCNCCFIYPLQMYTRVTKFLVLLVIVNDLGR